MNREEGNRASLFACAAALAVVGLAAVAWGAPERTAPKKDVEVVAVYYPHWHNYPKGIAWFGEKWKTGEWDFVKTARRLFPGHKQPLVPTPGYLDGANPKDVETEIALAANAGIDVFLWDYYWYGGKVTQEESIEQGFLKAKNCDRMKFALMWCYHERNDQFRPGLGPERRRLMSLDHTPEEFLGLIDHAIARYFNRPEYWRKDGKLFFSVYNAAYLLKTWGGDTSKVRAATDEARRRVRAAGLGELHLNAQNLQPAQVPLAVEMGFDSLTDYNLVASYAPNYWKRYAAGERLFGYDEIGAGIESRWKAMQATALPYFPNVSTGWDSTPRCRLDAPFPWPKTAQYPYCATLTNNTPDRFEAYLRAAKAHVLADPKKPGVVYVNGWNEYTEGTYLLPNNFDSDGFLRAIAAVFGRQPANEYTYVNPSTKQLLTVPAATHENVAYGPHPKQKVDVFLPPGAKGPTPVVVYLHGGGWTGGAMVDHILGTSLKPLLARGVAVVAVGYRYIRDARLDGVMPPVKACLDDAEAAVRFVKAHAKEWNLDVSRLALAGGSAGACTVLYLGLKDDNALGVAALGPIIAQTSLDPRETRDWIPNATYGAHAFGFRNFDDWLAHRADALPWIARFSPAALARKISSGRAPKMFLQYGSLPKAGELARDPTHSGAFGVRFKELCDARGIPCEVFVDGRTPCFGETFRRLADTLTERP